MEVINTGFDTFIEKYKPIRNVLSQYSNLNNLKLFRMFDAANEDELGYVELYASNKEDEKYVWSVYDNNVVKNGVYFTPDVIGYLVCKNKWKEKRGTINYQI